MNNKDKEKTFFICICQIVFALHRSGAVDVYKHGANCNKAVMF